MVTYYINEEVVPSESKNGLVPPEKKDAQINFNCMIYQDNLVQIA